MSENSMTAETAKRDQAALQQLMSSLFTNPEVEQVVLGDPRFRWLLQRWLGHFNVEMTIGEAVNILVSSPRFDKRAVGEFLEDLVEYTAELLNNTLENELFGLLALLIPDARHFDPLLRRFGWAGGPPLTLAEAAALIGVSRERERQIQERIELDFQAQRVWTPVLDRAFNIIRRASPMPIQGVGPVLNRAGITARADFDAHGLLHADEIFHRDRRITKTSHQDWEFIVRSGEMPDLGFFTKTRTAIQKYISNQGMASLDALVSQVGRGQFRRADVLHTVAMVADWRLIDDRWIMPRDADSRNPLLNRIRKVLAIVPRCSLIPLHIQLLREDRADRRLDLSIDALRAFVAYHPDLELLGNELVASTRILLTSEVLSESEQAILAAFHAAGRDLSYASIVDAIEAVGLSSITAALTARTSPIIQKRERNLYALLSVRPAQAGDVDGSIAADDHVRASSDNAFPIVRATARHLLKAEGCTNLTRLRNTLAAESNRTSKQNVFDAIANADEFAMLDGEWFTTFDQEIENPLLAQCIQLRKQGLTVNEDTLRTRGVTVPRGPLKVFLSQWERESERRVWDQIDVQTGAEPAAVEARLPSAVPTISSIREVDPPPYAPSVPSWEPPVLAESAISESKLTAFAEPPPTLARHSVLSVENEILRSARRIVERDGCGHRATLEAILRGHRITCDRALLDKVLDASGSIVFRDSEWFTMLGTEIDNPLQNMVTDMEARGLPWNAKVLVAKGAVLPRRPLQLFADALGTKRSGPAGETIDPLLAVTVQPPTITQKATISVPDPVQSLVDMSTVTSATDVTPLAPSQRVVGRHATIRDVAHALIARRGCVPVRAVWDAFELESATLDRNAITQELHAIPEIVWLDSGWITSFAPTFENGLMDQMRGRKTRIRGGDLRTLADPIPVSIRELFISHYILWRQEKPEALEAGIVGQPRHLPSARSAPSASALEIAPELDHQPLIGESPDDFPDGLAGNIQRTVTRYGVVQVEDLYIRFSSTRRAAIDAEIKQLVKAGYEWIDGSYLTIINPAYDNRLTTRLRRLLAVFANGCTVELACQQLGRNPAAFPRIAPSTLKSFVRKHPEFLLDGKLIRTRLATMPFHISLESSGQPMEPWRCVMRRSERPSTTVD